MTLPDWYTGWRHDAVHEIIAKNDRIQREFSLNRWPRYEYNLDDGKLLFLEGGDVKVVADIQIAGSTSGRAKNWLWAWDNAHWPVQCVEFSEAARKFGQDNAIQELSSNIVEADELNDLGWALTAATVKINGALGAYRPPRDDGGGLYLVYKRIGWAN